MAYKKTIISCGLLLVAIFFAFRLPTPNSYNIVFVGDSITESRMVEHADVNGPAAKAAAYLTATGKFKAIQFNNQGRSGFTTVDFLPVGNNAFPKVVAAADAFKITAPATLVFSIMLGTNDSAVKGPHGSPVSPENYRANLKTITDSLLTRYPQCKIVINEPLWYSDSTRNSSTYLVEGRERLQSYMPQIEDLVKAYKSTHPHQVFLGDKKAYNYFKDHYLTDMNVEKGPAGTFYLHPNAKGASALGVFWGQAIAKILN